MPLVPPVMMATLPSRRPVILVLLAGFVFCFEFF
jgi:hypothetical protein